MNVENLKLTALINAYCLTQIPLLAFATPSVVQLTDTHGEVRIRLNRRTRNHLGVMYFGALAMGAELSIALKAVQTIWQKRAKVDFIFKDFAADFKKRADGDVHFVCEEASLVKSLIDEASTSTERLERHLTGYAYVPSKSKDPIMTYRLTLSVKRRS